MKKFLSVTGKILGFGLMGVTCLVLLLIATNFVWTAIEKLGDKPIGKMVDVEGSKIHVYTNGAAGPNVVLLSGLGTLAPAVDFLPLVRELNQKTRVSVVEYPGYGWSQDSDKPRSTETSVLETRTALREAGILPPYILVAHSISGLQALWFSNHFPNEVAGIVGLDSSFPEQIKSFSPNQESVNSSEILRWLGMVRIAILLNPALSGAPVSELTPDEVAQFAKLTTWNFGSHAIWNETNGLRANFSALLGTQFPTAIPVTLILASESASKLEPGIQGTVWVSEHEKQIAGNPNAKIVILNGSHYIHHGNAKQVAQLVLDVVDKADTKAKSP